MNEQRTWKRFLALLGLVLGLAGFIGGAVIVTMHRGWGLGFLFLGLGLLLPGAWALYCEYRDAHKLAQVEEEREAARPLIETLEAEHPWLSDAMSTPPIVEPMRRFWPVMIPLALVLAGVGTYFLATTSASEVDAETAPSTTTSTATSSSTTPTSSSQATSSSSAASSSSATPTTTQETTPEPTPSGTAVATPNTSPAVPTPVQPAPAQPVPNQPAPVPAAPTTDSPVPENPAPAPQPENPSPTPDNSGNDDDGPAIPWPTRDPFGTNDGNANTVGDFENLFN